jgi:hypothetical protein
MFYVYICTYIHTDIHTYIYAEHRSYTHTQHTHTHTHTHTHICGTLTQYTHTHTHTQMDTPGRDADGAQAPQRVFRARVFPRLQVYLSLSSYLTIKGNLFRFY